MTNIQTLYKKDLGLCLVDLYDMLEIRDTHGHPFDGSL